MPHDRFPRYFASVVDTRVYPADIKHSIVSEMYEIRRPNIRHVLPSSRVVLCHSKGNRRPETPPEFVVVRTRADGNCLFNAIVQSRSLNYGTGGILLPEDEFDQARQLRADVVALLHEHRAFIEGFLSLSFDEYVTFMSQDGTWGGEPELSMASIALDAAISVYSAPDLLLLSEYDLAEARASSGMVIPVLYHQNLHYEALKFQGVEAV